MCLALLFESIFWGENVGVRSYYVFICVFCILVVRFSCFPLNRPHATSSYTSGSYVDEG